ncbi:MAG: cytochrome C [Actinobacteria bacterium]|nr:cytochrome C [Actinomycetota bacterium]
MQAKLSMIAIAAALCLGGNAFLNTTVYAAHSDFGCGDCHAPHRAGQANDAGAYGVPLWNTANTADGLPAFQLYSSRTLDARDISQPDGPSRLCLGCHDGSYESSKMPSQAIFEPGDLAKIHPISFTYDSSLAARDGTLNDPLTSASGFGGTIDQDLLDEKHKLQCSSCHDVHSTGIGKYQLRWQYSDSDAVMCSVCHNK